MKATPRHAAIKPEELVLCPRCEMPTKWRSLGRHLDSDHGLFMWQVVAMQADILKKREANDE